MRRWKAADRKRKAATPQATDTSAKRTGSSSGGTRRPSQKCAIHGQGELIGENHDRQTLQGVEQAHGGVVATQAGQEAGPPSFRGTVGDCHVYVLLLVS